MATPNMGLTVPTVGSTTGPQWANEINVDLSIIDSHNHTATNGVQIPTAGLNINGDLTFNASYSPTDVKSVAFTSQAAPIASLLNRIYVSSGNLYFNNGSGTPVQITLGNSVVGASGNITGSNFLASYNAGTFTWQSDTSVPANMDCASVLIRQPSVGAVGVQLKSPAITLSNQILTLPATPAAQSVVTMSPSGVQTTAVVNSTLSLTSGLLKVNDSGITSTQLANNAVSTAKIQDGAVTRFKLASLYNDVSEPSGVQNITSTSFIQVPSNNPLYPIQITGLTNIIASRPIIILLQAIGDVTIPDSGALFLPSSGTFEMYVRIVNNPNSIDFGAAYVSLYAPNAQVAPSAISYMYIPPYGGAYSFYLYARVGTAGQTATIRNCRLVAYQL